MIRTAEGSINLGLSLLSHVLHATVLLEIGKDVHANKPIQRATLGLHQELEHLGSLVF